MGGGAGRGRKGGPTGRRQFSSIDDMKSGQVSEPAWKARRNRNEEGEAAEDPEEEESSEEEEEGEPSKGKGVASLIEVQNPNAPVKSAIKASAADVNHKTELSRREREEIEKQRSKERYLKLQAEGKTEQAQKDLARLELIRTQREEAAQKREEERLAKESKKKDGRK